MTQPGENATSTPAQDDVPTADEAVRLALTPEGDDLGATDTGNALRFQDLFRDVARLRTDDERWALWNGRRWELDTPGSLKAFGLTLAVVRVIRQQALELPDEAGPNGADSPRTRMLKHARATESVQRRRAVLAAAAGLPDLQAAAGDFDARRDALATPSLLLELAPSEEVAQPGGALGAVDPSKAKARAATFRVAARPLSRLDMVTRGTGAEYRPEVLDEANTPQLIRDYLETFVPDPVRQKMLFKALGAGLAGGNQARLFIIIQGESTTGKTQLVEAIYEALGTDYATIGTASVFRGNLDDRARPDILKAISRRLAFFSEASRAWELHGDRIKDLTGGGTVSARLMRENEFKDVRPEFTPVLVTNVMPKIIGADPALLRRMLVFDFTHRPLVEDPLVRDRFIRSREVREWLLARLVRGYEEVVNEGLGDVLVAQGLATMEAFENLTHLGAFFRWLTDTDQLITVPDEDRAAYGVKSTYVTLKEMYDRYSYWVKEYGGKRDQSEKLDYEQFNEQLRNNGWVAKKSGQHRWEGRRLISLVNLHLSG